MYIKRLDVALSDIEIIADSDCRTRKERNMDVLKHQEMWFLMGAMSLLAGFVIWLIEKGDNLYFNGFGSMLWFSITVLFLVQSKSLRLELNYTFQAISRLNLVILTMKQKSWIPQDYWVIDFQYFLLMAKFPCYSSRHQQRNLD